MKARGILVRDRSKDWGCDGCVRITAGWQAHTDRLLAALHETLKEIGWAEEQDQDRDKDDKDKKRTTA